MSRIVVWLLLIGLSVCNLAWGQAPQPNLRGAGLVFECPTEASYFARTTIFNLSNPSQILTLQNVIDSFIIIDQQLTVDGCKIYKKRIDSLGRYLTKRIEFLKQQKQLCQLQQEYELIDQYILTEKELKRPIRKKLQYLQGDYAVYIEGCKQEAALQQPPPPKSPDTPIATTQDSTIPKANTDTLKSTPIARVDSLVNTLPANPLKPRAKTDKTINWEIAFLILLGLLVILCLFFTQNKRRKFLKALELLMTHQEIHLAQKAVGRAIYELPENDTKEAWQANLKQMTNYFKKRWPLWRSSPQIVVQPFLENIFSKDLKDARIQCEFPARLKMDYQQLIILAIVTRAIVLTASTKTKEPVIVWTVSTLRVSLVLSQLEEKILYNYLRDSLAAYPLQVWAFCPMMKRGVLRLLKKSYKLP